MHHGWKIYSSDCPLDIVTEYLADSDLLTKLEIASHEGVQLGGYFNFPVVRTAHFDVLASADVRSWVRQICEAMEVKWFIAFTSHARD